MPQSLLAGLSTEETQQGMVEVLVSLQQAVQSLNRTVGQVMPDAAGRQRVQVEAIAGGLTIGTVSTINSLTNQVNVGNIPANEHIPVLMRLGADAIRRNISVS